MFTKEKHMSREERRLWILNDEGLYNLWQRSGKSLDDFIDGEAKVVDEVQKAVVSGKQPAHYLAYPRKK